MAGDMAVFSSVVIVKIMTDNLQVKGAGGRCGDRESGIGDRRSEVACERAEFQIAKIAVQPYGYKILTPDP